MFFIAIFQGRLSSGDRAEMVSVYKLGFVGITVMKDNMCDYSEKNRRCPYNILQCTLYQSIYT